MQIIKVLMIDVERCRIIVFYWFFSETLAENVKFRKVKSGLI
jgi:hypothetical protein